MALTVSIIERTIYGDQKVTIADVTFDSSYPTGGEPLSLQQLGLDQVNFLWSQPTGGYQVEWDGANKKLLVRGTGSANKAIFTEQDNATNLSTLKIRIMAFGR